MYNKKGCKAELLSPPTPPFQIRVKQKQFKVMVTPDMKQRSIDTLCKIFLPVWWTCSKCSKHGQLYKV